MAHDIKAEELVRLPIEAAGYTKTLIERFKPEQIGYPTEIEIAEGLLVALSQAGFKIVREEPVDPERTTK